MAAPVDRYTVASLLFPRGAAPYSETATNRVDQRLPILRKRFSTSDPQSTVSFDCCCTKRKPVVGHTSIGVHKLLYTI